MCESDGIHCSVGLAKMKNLNYCKLKFCHAKSLWQLALGLSLLSYNVYAQILGCFYYFNVFDQQF